ncbi:MAG: dihydrofolate reductase [Bacteroidales bacterium]|nr:dihydrofolate reductase [Bacteroidales bacterium]OJX90340.1 MAG: diacylglycerol kinase [Paludibacter sp. 47-17]
MPTISIIAAVADNLAIGYKKQIPWYLPADLKHFKEITTGHTLIMGKRTFESLPNGPLPNRKNIVLTSMLTEGVVEGYFEADSTEDALELSSNAEKVFIIGGSAIYKQFMEHAETMYITWVHGEFVADTFFPDIDFSLWNEVSREEHQPDEKNPHSYAFVVYERKK